MAINHQLTYVKKHHSDVLYRIAELAGWIDEALVHQGASA
jgi:hypothetical protein